METVVVENGDTVIVKNENTTIGYATFDSRKRELTYLFVNPTFRRKGYGKLLKEKAEQTSGCPLSPSDPISPLGQKFFNITMGHSSEIRKR